MASAVKANNEGLHSMGQVQGELELAHRQLHQVAASLAQAGLLCMAKGVREESLGSSRACCTVGSGVSYSRQPAVDDLKALLQSAGRPFPISLGRPASQQLAS